MNLNINKVLRVGVVSTVMTGIAPKTAAAVTSGLMLSAPAKC